MIVAWLAALVAEDVRDLANEWKRDYNAAVVLLDQGDAAGALPLASRALAVAPTEPDKNRVRCVVADAASKVGDRLAEFNALDALLLDPKTQWQLFWNGALDATQDGYTASAYRYAMAAFDRTKDKHQAAPVALAAALAVERLDPALEILRSLDRSECITPKGQLVALLVARSRCDDARRVATEFAPPGDAYAPLREAAGSCP